MCVLPHIHFIARLLPTKSHAHARRSTKIKKCEDGRRLTLMGSRISLKQFVCSLQPQASERASGRIRDVASESVERILFLSLCVSSCTLVHKLDAKVIATASTDQFIDRLRRPKRRENLICWRVSAASSLFAAAAAAASQLVSSHEARAKENILGLAQLTLKCRVTPKQ